MIFTNCSGGFEWLWPNSVGRMLRKDFSRLQSVFSTGRQDAARDETIESLWLEAAALAAWTAAGRVLLVPGVKWKKPYADNEAELIVERLRLGIPDAVKLADLFAELSDAAPA